MRIEHAEQVDALDFDRSGLVTVVAQHAHSGEVLMVAWADREALTATLDTGAMHYHSRSRDALWRKGETSGHTQRLVSLHADCDSDTVLARVLPAGPTCHTGAWSCFHAPPTLPALAAIIEDRRDAAPDTSYTARLLQDRNLRLKKLGEEAAELAVACADETLHVAEEAADLLYHVLVACAAAGVPADDVLAELEQRRGGEGVRGREGEGVRGRGGEGVRVGCGHGNPVAPDRGPIAV